MAFSLNKKAKQVSKTELFKVEHIVGNEFVTVVLDLPLRVETNPVEKEILVYLEKMLPSTSRKFKVCAFVILFCT